MDSTGIVPTMPITGNGLGFGGGEGIWLFALIVLLGMSNGGLFGGNGLGYRQATAEDVSNGFNFSELQSENRDILGAIASDTASTIAAVERVGSGLVNNIHDVAMGVAESRFEQQNCCCSIQRAVDGVNYNGALNTAAINATTTAQTQKILDALAADKAERQAARIAQLEQQIAMQGVVRYPTAMTYGAGPSPFCPGCSGNI